MDWPTVAAFSNTGLTLALGLIIFLSNRSERQRDADRAGLLAEIQADRVNREKCQDTQRKCQLSLVEDYRTKGEAQRDWDKQGLTNNELFSRTNDLKNQFCKLEVRIGAK